ncbi:hypothetical protein K3U93_23930 [Mycobacterium malmoense]|uniref:hypothetical protein n=1 Tax=Mycobacterium malmoense TaxID=1780 RepID=UPI0015930377|nr:hypothetical protein [Mycobacterium malmoense]QZA17566.1 hypothetical protein K3U93_23930 [Mycobacterium malmoense]UNB94349.1 hypothetical protein H5T25_23910 [Mycobacterium malmoense]
MRQKAAEIPGNPYIKSSLTKIQKCKALSPVLLAREDGALADNAQSLARVVTTS